MWVLKYGDQEYNLTAGYEDGKAKPRPYTVGRNAFSDIVISDTSVSRHHMTLTVHPTPRSSLGEPSIITRITLRDKSKFGTRINGDKVALDDDHVLSPSDRIQCSPDTGSAEMVLSWVPLVACTSGMDSVGRESLGEMVAACGGHLLRSWENGVVSHLVQRQGSVTLKLIKCLTQVKPVVRPDWFLALLNSKPAEPVPSHTNHAPQLEKNDKLPSSVDLAPNEARAHLLLGRNVLLLDKKQFQANREMIHAMGGNAVLAQGIDDKALQKMAENEDTIVIEPPPQQDTAAAAVGADVAATKQQQQQQQKQICSIVSAALSSSARSFINAQSIPLAVLRVSLSPLIGEGPYSQFASQIPAEGTTVPSSAMVAQSAPPPLQQDEMSKCGSLAGNYTPGETPRTDPFSCTDPLSSGRSGPGILTTTVAVPPAAAPAISAANTTTAMASSSSSAAAAAAAAAATTTTTSTTTEGQMESPKLAQQPSARRGGQRRRKPALLEPEAELGPESEPEPEPIVIAPPPSKRHSSTGAGNTVAYSRTIPRAADAISSTAAAFSAASANFLSNRIGIRGPNYDEEFDAPQQTKNEWNVTPTSTLIVSNTTAKRSKSRTKQTTREGPNFKRFRKTVHGAAQQRPILVSLRAHSGGDSVIKLSPKPKRSPRKREMQTDFESMAGDASANESAKPRARRGPRPKRR